MITGSSLPFGPRKRGMTSSHSRTMRLRSSTIIDAALWAPPGRHALKLGTRGAPADESIHDGDDIVFLVVEILRFEYAANALEVV